VEERKRGSVYEWKREREEVYMSGREKERKCICVDEDKREVYKLRWE